MQLRCPWPDATEHTPVERAFRTLALVVADRGRVDAERAVTRDRRSDRRTRSAASARPAGRSAATRTRRGAATGPAARPTVVGAAEAAPAAADAGLAAADRTIRVGVARLAAALLQVSQAHLGPVAPEQFGLAVVIALLTVPVELLRSIGSVAMVLAVVAGQSRLVWPKSGRPGHRAVGVAGLRRCARRPSTCRRATLSLMVRIADAGRTRRVGRRALWTREIRFATVTASPVSTFAVPLTLPLNWLRDAGADAARDERQRAAEEELAGATRGRALAPRALAVGRAGRVLVRAADAVAAPSTAHCWCTGSRCRWCSAGCGSGSRRVFAIGPLTVHCPHGREVARAADRLTVTSPFEMTGAPCAMPFQPVSRIVAGSAASPAKWILAGTRHTCRSSCTTNAALVLETV